MKNTVRTVVLAIALASAALASGDWVVFKGQVNGPVDRMFSQLKERLDRLPTRKQRAEAAQPEPEAAGGKGGREAPLPDKVCDGQAAIVRFDLDLKQLGFYDEDMRYVVEPGELTVQLGTSSEDIRLEETITTVGEMCAVARREVEPTRVVVERLPA